MTNKEILQKAIEKAEKNGFKYGYDWHGRDEAIFYMDAWHSLIFDHEFAKAFFTKYPISYCEFGYNNHHLYHLQQMVLEKEPLKYLERFLDK